MIRERIIEALTKSVPGADFLLSFSDDEKKGHLATNVALVAAKALGVAPRELAEKIKNQIEGELADIVARIDIAGPGFINFFLTEDALAADLALLEGKMKEGFNFNKEKQVNIEFISANPTGELHIGHGRGAFYGDTLANVLAFSGASVTREYYINDSRESNQIAELGKTALGLGETYLTEALKEKIGKLGLAAKDVTEAGFALAAEIQKDNQEFIEGTLGISFNEWYSEDERLRASLRNERMLAALKMKGLTYEKEGAVWLKTSEYGDDEDRVVVRSDGKPSYFLSDIAYHDEKFSRGYDSVINVWGADHHGHVKRIEAVQKMLGWQGELKIFITQLVSLKHGEEISKMSKRAGNVVYLRDLVAQFGLDVVRWFYNEKSLNTHMEFDARLAKERSEKNPVFYVQYAHARICSVMEKAKGLAPDGTSLLAVMREPSARFLSLKLIQFEEIVAMTAEDSQVHRLTAYAYQLASAFSAYYRDVRIVNEDSYNEGAYALIEKTRVALAKTLALLGISAPAKM